MIVLALLAAIWLMIGFFKLWARVTWGIVKLIAVILFIPALPLIIVLALLVGGAAVLLPLLLLAGAVGLLAACAA